MTWTLSHKADKAGARLADGHYSRRTVGSPQFMPPCETYVFVALKAVGEGWRRTVTPNAFTIRTLAWTENSNARAHPKVDLLTLRSSAMAAQQARPSERRCRLPVRAYQWHIRGPMPRLRDRLDRLETATRRFNLMRSLDTRCGLCNSGAVDRRTLYGGDGPDEAAESWKCVDCGAYTWLYCDGTLADWLQKPRTPSSH
jgi:hypothetical protein